METMELFYPQIAVRAGAYRFDQGVEVEVHSSRTAYFDWAKIRFTEQFQPRISLDRMDAAAIEMGYNGVLDEVFTGYVAKPYSRGASANEIVLKDEMLLLEQTSVNATFLETTPQEVLAYILGQAGIGKMALSGQGYPTRKRLPIHRQTGIQAINTVNAAWGLKKPFFCSGGVFYWGTSPAQEKVYSFEYGVNILALNRTGGVWELETISAPFVKHSHKILVTHPLISGEFEVSQVLTITNDAGFIRTYIYF